MYIYIYIDVDVHICIGSWLWHAWSSCMCTIHSHCKHWRFAVQNTWELRMCHKQHVGAENVSQTTRGRWECVTNNTWGLRMCHKRHVGAENVSQTTRGRWECVTNDTWALCICDDMCRPQHWGSHSSNLSLGTDTWSLIRPPTIILCASPTYIHTHTHVCILTYIWPRVFFF